MVRGTPRSRSRKTRKRWMLESEESLEGFVVSIHRGLCQYSTLLGSSQRQLGLCPCRADGRQDSRFCHHCRCKSDLAPLFLSDHLGIRIRCGRCGTSPRSMLPASRIVTWLSRSSFPLCWRTSWQRLRRWPTARLVVEFVRQTDSEVRGNTVGIRVGVLEVGLGPR